MTSEEFLKEYLCSHCHIALLYEHQEFKDYIKCILCGFTKKHEIILNDCHKLIKNG